MAVNKTKPQLLEELRKLRAELAEAREKMAAQKDLEAQGAKAPPRDRPQRTR